MKFLAELPGDFVSDEVEATRHLPLLGDEPSCTTGKHIRGTALGKLQVPQVFKKSISPGTTNSVTEIEINSLLRQIKNPFQTMSERTREYCPTRGSCLGHRVPCTYSNLSDFGFGTSYMLSFWMTFKR